jgi:hypothetical protein
MTGFRLRRQLLASKTQMFVREICEKRPLGSSKLPVRPSIRPRAWNNPAPTGRNSMELDIWIYFENPSRKLKFDWSLTKITGTLHEDSCTSTSIIPPRLSSENKKCFRWKLQRKSKQILYSIYFFPKNISAYEIMWKNMVVPDGSHITIYYGACASHTGYVTQ